MKKIFLSLLAAGTAFSSWAASDDATIASEPSPAVINRPVSVTITTTNFGSDVYVYTWALAGSTSKEAAAWDDTNVEKYKMSGSNGVYTYRIEDIKSFYGLSDSQLSELSKLGFIAKTSNGKQTADCFIEVTQAPVQRYSGGQGTVAEPYVISTTADLKELSATTADWDKCFRLDADIDASGVTSPIGDNANPFRGVFDGNGKTVSNLVISGQAFGQGTGLFGTVGSGAEIRDLGIADANISGGCFTGILAGLVNGGNIYRCYSSGTVKASSICVGGLVGENGGTISDCYSTADVSAPGDYAVGGLVGKNSGSVSNAIASGNVSGFDYVGGLVGANYGSVTHSLSANAGIAATNNYAARFGGNNNGQNVSTGNYAWDMMPFNNSGWTRYGDHATLKTSNDFSSESVYREISGWDFENVWVWRTENARAAVTYQGPVLRSLGESQPRIFPDALFSAISSIEDIKGDGVSVAVSPNPTCGRVTVSAPAAILSCKVFAIGGQMVAQVDGNGACDASIDLSASPAGLYLLQVEMEGSNPAIVKIIKK